MSGQVGQIVCHANPETETVSDSDEMGYIRPACQLPPPDRSGTEWRRPQNEGAPPPPPPTWQFDVAKLQRLIERAGQAHLLRRDLNERIREARMHLSRLRIAAEQELRGFGAVHRTTRSALEGAEAELARLIGEQAALTEKTESVVRTGAACESWARQQGWTPGGSRGVTPPPQVGPADPAPMLAGWGR